MQSNSIYKDSLTITGFRAFDIFIPNRSVLNILIYVFICFKELNELTVVCKKPNFELNSSVKLSFAKKAAPASVWKLDDIVDDDIIDPDSLLDDDDFKKPAPESLKGK